ncbi:unnamed protein product [Phyllotreta striolata]|uniref:Uncharacterized protein n=1 Tax=Phyllotreta striolata TaxID=444603 RepID=A0A9N9TXC6_PHYSR|nr:unnamed protein product [Phyllotreta striolata]
MSQLPLLNGPSKASYRLARCLLHFHFCRITNVFYLIFRLCLHQALFSSLVPNFVREGEYITEITPAEGCTILKLDEFV